MRAMHKYPPPARASDKETIKTVTFVFECRFIYLPFFLKKERDAEDGEADVSSSSRWS